MITWNAAAQITALGAILLVQMAYLIVAARFLGPEGFGSYSFVFSITQILLVGGDLGLHNTAIRRISSRRADSESIFATFFSLKALVAGMLLALTWIIALFLPADPSAKLCLILLGPGMFFHLNTLSLSIAFQAHGKLYLASFNSLLLVVLHASTGISGLALGGGLGWLGFSYLAASAAALLVNWRIFSARIHPVRRGWPQDWRDFFRDSLPVGLGAFFENVAIRISFTLLSLLAGSQETGYFSAASRITGAARNLPAGIFSAVLPVMAELQGRWDRLSGLLRRSLAVVILIALPSSLLLLLFAGPLVDLLYGPAYSASAASLRILAAGMVPAFLSISFTYTMLSQKAMLRRYARIACFGMCLNLVLNLILIPGFGSRGAALSGLITDSLTAGVSGAVIWFSLRNGRRTGAGPADNRVEG